MHYSSPYTRHFLKQRRHSRHLMFRITQCLDGINTKNDESFAAKARSYMGAGHCSVV